MNHVSRILTYLDSADYQLGAPSGTIRAAARRGRGSSVCGGTREREDEQEEQGKERPKKDTKGEGQAQQGRTRERGRPTCGFSSSSLPFSCLRRKWQARDI